MRPDGFTTILRGGGGMKQRAGRVHACGHVGELELDALEFLDEVAELVTLVGIRHAQIERMLRDADRLRGDSQAAVLE